MINKIGYNISFFLLVTFGNACFSQDHILSTIDNVVYEAVSNTLTINLDENECKKIIFKTNNGTLERQGCYVAFTPNQVEVARIEIYKNHHGKQTKIGESVFRVRPLPDPFARFGGLSGGKISKEKAMVMGGLICYLPNLNCQPTIAVDSYSVIIVKGPDSILVEKNIGARLEGPANDMIRKLDQGNILIFSQIVVHAPDNTRRTIHPIEFLIE